MFDFGRSISDAVRSRMAAVEQHREAVKQPQEKQRMGRDFVIQDGARFLM